MVAPLLVLALLAQGDASVTIRNRSPQPRHETVRFSVPFARGEVRDLQSVRIGETDAAAVPLLRWPDGSVAVAQAHARLAFAAGERRQLSIGATAPTAAAADGAVANEFSVVSLPMRTEVEDAWGRVYTARPILLDAPVAGSSPLVEVRRLQALHERDGTVFLALSGYLMTFRGERRAELTLVLDNARLPGQAVLGPVRLRSFALVTEDADLRVRPRFIAENLLQPPERRDAGWRQVLLGPSDQIYLGDGTGKAFRFDLFFDGEGATEDDRANAAAAAAAALHGFAQADWVRRSRAFALHGGPAPAALDLSNRQLAAWRQGNDFGPFGGHGDPRDAAAQGTPRNGASTLHNVVRWASDELLEAAESMVLQHCLRPPPGSAPRLPGDTAALRQGLSPRTVQRPHGFTALDYEHFSVDLLYEFYWLTGDPLAREELARMGRGLRPLLAALPFVTARGEGWCLQAGVAIARATDDRQLLEDLHQRFVERILPQLGRPPQTCALPQPAHADAFGGLEPFDAPWQMAALVHGLHALWIETGDDRIAAAARDVGEIMATSAWLEGEGPKYIVSATDPLHFLRPRGFGVLEGTAWLQTGAFVLAAELVDATDPRQGLFLRRAEFIVRPWRNEPWYPAHPWFQLYLDRRSSR